MRDLSKRNIIILSSIDWDSHKQLHHNFFLYQFILNCTIILAFIANT